MEAADRELILRRMPHNPALRKLYLEHEDYENRLGELRSFTFLTPDEEIEEKRLKQQKLHGVDRMMKILQEQREESAVL